MRRHTYPRAALQIPSVRDELDYIAKIEHDTRQLQALQPDHSAKYASDCAALVARRHTKIRRLIREWCAARVKLELCDDGRIVCPACGVDLRMRKPKEVRSETRHHTSGACDQT